MTVAVSLISVEQPAPYMDELFHVRQTQNYCNGSYEVCHLFGIV